MAGTTLSAKPGSVQKRMTRKELFAARLAEYQGGKSISDIARDHGVSRQTISRSFQRHGVEIRQCEYQEFNGKRYRRDTFGYWVRGRSGEIRMHREVWEYYNGPIPHGWHVHHEDENPANNRIENLDCLSPSAHRRLHASRRVVIQEKKQCALCGATFRRSRGRSRPMFANQRLCSMACHGRFRSQYGRVTVASVLGD